MAKSNRMAGNGDGKGRNRSEAIREALAQNPTATSKEIITKLAEWGLKVSPTLVYFVKSKQNQARRKAKRARVAEESRRTATRDPVELVASVKHLAREVGGIHNLKKLVDLLAD